MRPSLTDALTGCLLGQALGDALGFVVEAEPPEIAGAYVEGCLRAGHAGSRSHPDFAFGQYSDDTQLARELLCSIRATDGWDPADFGRRIGALFEGGRAVGAGPGTRFAAERLLAGVMWEEAGRPAPYAGNGSAMRAAPIGVLFRDDLETMRRVAVEQSCITHKDPRCAAGSLVVAGGSGTDLQRRVPPPPRNFSNGSLSGRSRKTSRWLTRCVGLWLGSTSRPWRQPERFTDLASTPLRGIAGAGSRRSWSHQSRGVSTRFFARPMTTGQSCPPPSALVVTPTPWRRLPERWPEHEAALALFRGRSSGFSTTKAPGAHRELTSLACDCARIAAISRNPPPS